MDSILTSVKKMLGIAEEYEFFDADIIIHINSVFSILAQLGVGASEGFLIEDKSAVWGDYISEDENLQLIKSYMYLKVRQLFDSSLSSSVNNAVEKIISELEWRINTEIEASDESD